MLEIIIHHYLFHVKINFNLAIFFFLCILYMVKHFEKTVGSPAEVWHGVAERTSGRDYKKDLLQNNHRRIVSKKIHILAKKSIKKNLFEKDYNLKKGKFVVMRKSMKKSKK